MLISIPANLNASQHMPAGIYKALVTSTNFKTAASGNDMTVVEFTIQSQGPDEGMKTIGRKQFDNWVWSEKSLGVVASKFKALIGEDLPAGEFNTEQLHMMISNKILNKECLLQLTVEPVKRDGIIAEGEFRNNIKKIQKVA